MTELPKGQTGLIIGCPIPRTYFESTGIGESDYQVHAGSYHMAMQQAGVERFNLVPYTSIMPAIARRVPLEDAVKDIQHGSEMKVIQAAAHVDITTGEKRATAAIIYAFLKPKNRRGVQHEGGLVCEYNGHGTPKEARENLEGCLQGLFNQPDRNGKKFSEFYDLSRPQFMSATIEPIKRFGTALVVIGFADYFVPVKAHNLPELEAAAAQSFLGKTGL